jgi:hypothetical protein
LIIWNSGLLCENCDMSGKSISKQHLWSGKKTLELYAFIFILKLKFKISIEYWKFWKHRIAPLMVTYHYVKFYVSIIIYLEVININVRNFNFPIRFYSTLSDFNNISYVDRLWCPELIPDIVKFLPVTIFKMVPTIPHKFYISNFDDIRQFWIFAVLWWPFWKWRPVEFFQCRESIRDIIIYPHTVVVAFIIYL